MIFPISFKIIWKFYIYGCQNTLKKKIISGFNDKECKKKKKKNPLYSIYSWKRNKPYNIKYIGKNILNVNRKRSHMLNIIED